MKTKYCKWCDTQFETEVSYQIYCSAVCREEATKEKIAERYIANKRRQQHKKPKTCKNCDSRLSVYNDEDLCVKCIVNPPDVKGALRDIRRLGKDG